MTSDIRLLYPDFQFNGTTTVNQSTASGRGVENLCTGPRNKTFALGTRGNSDLWVNIDLGSGNDATPDALFVGNAKLLMKDRLVSSSSYGVNTILVRKCTQSAFTPSSISNLKFWFDGSVGVTKNTSDQVTSWDNIGSSEDATNSAANAPVWNSRGSSTNQNPVLDFNGSSQWLAHTTSTGMQLKSALTVFLVVQYDAVATDRRIIQDYSAEENIPFWVDGGNVLSRISTGGSGSAAAGTLGSTYVYSLVFDGSQPDNATRLKRWRDGVQETLSFTGTIGASTANTAGIRLGRSNSANYFDGRMGEVIIYDAALSTTNRQNVEAYLTAKWQTAQVGGTTNFQAQTLYGPRSEDWLLALSTTSSRHWWVQMGCSLNTSIKDLSIYQHSKLFLGRYFDFGRDPSWGRKAVRTVLHNGNREPRYSFDFEWRGITNTNIQSFVSKIGKWIDTNPVVITTSSYHAVMADMRMILCKITDFTITPQTHDDNDISISFEELI